MKIMVDTTRHGNKIYDRLSRLSDDGGHTQSGAPGKREQNLGKAGSIIRITNAAILVIVQLIL